LAAPNSKIKRVADLKGVPVAVSGNTIQDFVSDQLMVAGGLKKGDIQKVEVPKVPIRFQMLMSGQVKAAALPDPMGALAEAQGATLVASDTDSKRNLSPIIYIFSAKSIETKTEAFRKFYKVYREAVNMINANPEKYRGLLVEKARVPEEIKDTYPMQRYPMPLLPTKGEFNMVQDWMLARKMIDRPMKYGDLFDARFTK
jgi:NitT/TauT family transport system substrate-binding protein